MHECAGKKYGAYRDVSGRAYPCSRRGTVERDGKWYCWQHDPERVKVDEEKRQAKWQAEQDARVARWARNAAARLELAAVDESLGEFYCPVRDPETDKKCGSYYLDHGVHLMRAELERLRKENDGLRGL